MLSKITSQLSDLPRAETTVAQFIVANPSDTLPMTLADLAHKTKVSEPSIIRFCRRLGCKGFSDFKIKLAGSIGSHSSFAHTDVNPGDDVSAVIDKVFSRSIRELQRIKNTIPTDHTEEAVKVLTSADRIELYGVGASGHVIADAQHKFFRLGKPCTAYDNMPSIKQAAAIADHSYCIIIVSKSGTSNEIVGVSTLAQKNGADVIAITAPNSPLSNCTSISLELNIQEDTGAYTPMSSRLTQLTVLDVLQVALALGMGEQAEEKHNLTKQALAKY